MFGRALAQIRETVKGELTPIQAAKLMFARRKARKDLYSYIQYCYPDYKTSLFAEMVCAAVDEFLERVLKGEHPVLVLQAPPQHGKSEIISRRLPAYIMGRFPQWFIGAASYSDELATSMAQAVRRNVNSHEHQELFPGRLERRKYVTDRIGEFPSPTGDGGYIGVGVGGGLTGRPVHILIIDDPTKDAKESLSPTVKKGHWDWYQTVTTTRMQEISGQIIMATPWAEDDLPGRILEHFKNDPEEAKRLIHLPFPAINDPLETGYRPELPLGALVPELHSLRSLKEKKKLLSEYWWCAIYQCVPQTLGGNLFKEKHARFYAPNEIPKTFDLVICSWDCTFKDTDGTDFVVGQVWGKSGADAYLLDQVRDRMSFTDTVKEVVRLRKKWPQCVEVLIEDKANGPAVINVLQHKVPGLIPVEPDGSKLARAYAVTSFWEAGNVYLPYAVNQPWVKPLMGELTKFPAAAHDDQVDAFSQALRRLYPLFDVLNVSAETILACIRG